MSLSSEELAAIRERAEAASNGPWGVYESAHGAGVECGSVDADDVGQLFVESYGLTYTPNPADAEFIAHAREDIPALLAEVERLTEVIERRGISYCTAEAKGVAEARLDKVRALADWLETLAGGDKHYARLIRQAIDGSDQ